MHQQEEKLQALKKESQQVKRRAIGAFKAVSVIFLILALLLTAAHFLLPLLETAADALLGSTLWQQLVREPSVGMAIRSAAQTVTALTAQNWFGLLRWIAPACWVVFYVMTLLWILRRPAWRKSMAYLNYRTMKNAMLDEKEGF